VPIFEAALAKRDSAKAGHFLECQPLAKASGNLKEKNCLIFVKLVAIYILRFTDVGRARFFAVFLRKIITLK
jgi:hypothetical protein